MHRTELESPPLEVFIMLFRFKWTFYGGSFSVLQFNLLVELLRQFLLIKSAVFKGLTKLGDNFVLFLEFSRAISCFKNSNLLFNSMKLT